MFHLSTSLSCWNTLEPTTSLSNFSGFFFQLHLLSSIDPTKDYKKLDSYFILLVYVMSLSSPLKKKKKNQLILPD